MTTSEKIENVLRNLRGSFSEDGFDLHTGAIDHDSVEVIIEALPGACLECLVPDEVMLQIFQNAIREAVPDVGAVTLTKTWLNGKAS